MLGLFLVLEVTLLTGCATPKAVTLSQLATTPELYRNKAVQFLGMVKESSYQVNGKVGLDLTVTDGTQEVHCYKESYNQRVMNLAARLTKRAKEEEGQIAVTGIVRAHDPRTDLELQILEYKGKSVDISLTNYEYRYPYHPYWNWSQPLNWRHPFRHQRH